LGGLRHPPCSLSVVCARAPLFLPSDRCRCQDRERSVMAMCDEGVERARRSGLVCGAPPPPTPPTPTTPTTPTPRSFRSVRRLNLFASSSRKPVLRPDQPFYYLLAITPSPPSTWQTCVARAHGRARTVKEGREREQEDEWTHLSAPRPRAAAVAATTTTTRDSRSRAGRLPAMGSSSAARELRSSHYTSEQQRR